jgi:Thioredoxin
MTFRIGCVALLTAFTMMGGCKEKQYLVGYYDWSRFQQECRWDTYLDASYQPDSDWMDSLSTLKDRDPVRVQLFLGCYCGDSKKWVPRFYKLMPDLPVSGVEIISVDTTKKDEKNLAAMAGVKKIPTFIFWDGDKELGRIVEKPKHGRIEKNVYQILKKEG